MKRRTYILTSLILTVLIGSLVVWNLSANTASAQKSNDLGVVTGVSEYNPRDEFALMQGGANGLWNYGYSTSDADNTLNLFNVATDADSVPIGCGSPFERWRINNAETIPQIARHNPAVTCANIPSNALFIHPGKNNQRAVFRFNAPTSGTFQITGTFQKQSLSATSDLKIIKNAALPGETVLYTGVIGAVYQQTFNFTVTIAAGDKIDFSVGDDGNDTWQNDGSSIAVTIGQPVTACLQSPVNLQVNVPAENSPVDVQSVNTNASLVGDATYTNSGKVGRAFELDGNGDYVRVEDTPSQRPGVAVTAEGWFKFDSVSGVVSLISKPIRGSTLNSYTLYLEGGQLRGLVGNALQFTRVFSNFTPQTGVWHHLAFTYDFTGGVSTLKLYANGVEVTSGQDGTANLPLFYDANPFPLLIGGEYENNTPGFTLDGQADEVSVYGRALSPNEIFDIVQQGSFGKCSPGSTCTQAPQGLVSFYKGEDNALDSNLLNPGTLQNGASFAPGIVGRAFSFNGANQYVLVGDPVPASLKIQNEISLEAWIYVTAYPTTPDGLGLIIGSQYDPQTAGATIFLDGRTNPDGQTAPSGHIHFQIGDGSSFHATNTNSQVPLNQWVHIAATRKANEDAKVYYNGVLQPLTSAPWSGSISYNGAWFTIGQQKGINRAFNGLIDEAAVFNRALTTGEVQSIYNAGASGKCLTAVCAQPPNNMVSWFAGEQNALDSKSNNHGTLQNGATFAPGRVGQAFSFDGVNDKVAVPNSPSLNITGNQLTIEAWINPTTVAGDRQIVSMASSTSFPAGRKFGLFIQNGFLGFEVNTSNGYTGSAPSTGAISPGVLTHVALVYNGSQVIKYVNGVAAGTATTLTGNIVSSTGDFAIGQFAVAGASSFQGLIDEVSVYDRALSTTEISSIYNAGQSGKCKPIGLNPAADQVAWFSGDGDTRDFLGLNPNGTLNGNANFIVGKVGQSFNFDGSDDNVAVANNANLNPTSQMTLETWVYKRTGGDSDLVGKDGETSERQYWLGAASNGRFRPHLSTTGSGLIFFDGATQYNLNEWYHLAMTYDGAALRLYVNGVLDGQIAASGSIITTSQPLRIGGGAPTGQLQNYLNGKLDEISLYSRALSASEIAAVYNAGTAGKLKSVVTPVNLVRKAKTLASLAPTTVQLSDATVTFAQVTSAGTTSQNSVDLGLLPKLPPSVTFTGLAYDISTTAAYQNGAADDVRVCFNAPALVGLNNLRILHLENGVWVNRTDAANVLPNLCTDNLASLSPFAIVQTLAPTAASVSVGGRVFDQNGGGISRVTVTITDTAGRTVSTSTNNFGIYRFENVAVGAVYFISVRSKRYQFTENTQVVNISDAVDNINFTAFSDALNLESTEKNAEEIKP